jgi:hypothetical protein
MSAIQPGATAPPVPGVTFDGGPHLLAFYKVTCPVCQMAAPTIQALADLHPDAVVPLGQDPPERLAAFAEEYGLRQPPIPELAPYEVSDAYGVASVPTLFLVGEDGTVLDTVESWSRDGYNRLAERLAGLTGQAYEPVSEPGDGLPPFRPG